MSQTVCGEIAEVEYQRPRHPFVMRRARLRSPIKIHGGKQYLAAAHHQAIRSCFKIWAHPSFHVDVCGGAATHLLNEPGYGGTVEIYNDLDPRKFNLFWVIRDAFDYFYDRLLEIPYSLAYWQGAFERDSAWSPEVGSVTWPDVARAVDYVVRSRMSRGGLGNTFGESSRLRGGQNEYANAWQTLRQHFPRVAARVARWVLSNEDAVTLIGRYAQNRLAFIYLDPPYLPGSRTAKRAYDKEMDHQQHVQLLESLQACKCRVALCGYHSDLYDRALRHWRLFEWNVKNNAGQGRVKQERIECLWVNAEAA